LWTFTVVLLVCLNIPLAFALRAWPHDRIRLGLLRQRAGWTALALTAGTSAFLALTLLRLNVVNRRVSFPENLHDWAFTAARIGLWFATAAMPMNLANIGRTRLYGLLATLVPWLFLNFIFASV